MTNYYTYISDLSNLNNILNTKINLSSVSVNLKIKVSKEVKKILLETEINILLLDTKTNIIKPPVSPLFIFEV